MGIADGHAETYSFRHGDKHRQQALLFWITRLPLRFGLLPLGLPLYKASTWILEPHMFDAHGPGPETTTFNVPVVGDVRTGLLFYLRVSRWRAANFTLSAEPSSSLFRTSARSDIADLHRKAEPEAAAYA